jgi:hypothetical protein
VTPLAALAALLLAGVGLAAVLAAIGEFLRLEQVRIEDGRVTVTRRGLAGTREWHASVKDYVGLEPLSRVRRLHVRNQGRPGGSLQGQVTEFVVVLRHRDDASRDLELFRVQPSLEILRAMHAVQSAGRRGGAAAAQATEHAARRYRDALATLCERLQLPALVAAGREGREPASLDELDLWLQRRNSGVSPED